VTKLVVALAFLGLNFYTYHFLATEAVIPPRESFASFPSELEGGWVCPEFQGMDKKVQRNLGVTDFLLCDFENRERRERINVYVGYHQTQVREQGGGAGENSIHPPAHCLPGSGWDIIHHEIVPLGVPPYEDEAVKRLVIAKGEARQLVYYWYQSRGRIVAEDWKKIVYVGLDRAVRGRTDGSLVRFTMPFGKRAGAEEEAEASFRSVAPVVLAQLRAYVPE
jgi:EpsI family protein